MLQNSGAHWTMSGLCIPGLKEKRTRISISLNIKVYIYFHFLNSHKRRSMQTRRKSNRQMYMYSSITYNILVIPHCPLPHRDIIHAILYQIKMASQVWEMGIYCQRCLGHNLKVSQNSISSMEQARWVALAFISADSTVYNKWNIYSHQPAAH